MKAQFFGLGLIRLGLCLGLSLSSVSASASTLRCTGLWAGVESIMNVSSVITLNPGSAPSRMSLTVNNAEFRGTMIPAGGGTFAFNVQRVGSSDFTLAGTLRFLSTVNHPASTGFVLHTNDGRIESILTCNEAAF